MFSIFHVVPGIDVLSVPNVSIQFRQRTCNGLALRSSGGTFFYYAQGLVHKSLYQGFATRGVGAICVEATAITPEGRISPEDAVNSFML
jgi:hypothetical protein